MTDRMNKIVDKLIDLKFDVLESKRSIEQITIEADGEMRVWLSNDSFDANRGDMEVTVRETDWGIVHSFSVNYVNFRTLKEKSHV